LPPVGNDIVDLGDPGNRGKSSDRRFVERVFTAGEQRRIAAAVRPDALLWALWAAREAAYKAFSRHDPRVASIPKTYRICLDGDGEAALAGRSGAAGLPFELGGRVIAPPGELALRLSLTEGYVHALAASEPDALAGICWRVAETDAAALPAEYPSALIRRLLLTEIAGRLGCPVEELTVRSEKTGPGAPGVFWGERLLTAGISLSHDGRFAAFALDPAAL